MRKKNIWKKADAERKTWKPGMIITTVSPGGIRRIFRVKRIPDEYKHLAERIRQNQRNTSLRTIYNKVPLDCSLQMMQQCFVPAVPMSREEILTHMHNLYLMTQDCAKKRKENETLV